LEKPVAQERKQTALLSFYGSSAAKVIEAKFFE
jgi:hypothetical protein